jgi:hypothetical protein
LKEGCGENLAINEKPENPSRKQQFLDKIAISDSLKGKNLEPIFIKEKGSSVNLKRGNSKIIN